MSNCYLCGRENATFSAKFKDTFTAHSSAKCPQSTKLCKRCDFSINLRANYLNPSKGKYSSLFGRNWSWLYQGDELISPTFNGEIDGLPIVENLPTREMIRGWLLNPPNPPFTIAIAESGQKHILYLAQEAHSKDAFPVQFELDFVLIKRQEFAQLLSCFESLMGLGATKTEILSGEFKSQFLIKNLNSYVEYEETIRKHRGKRLLELVSYVAMAAKIEPKMKEETPVKPAEKVNNTQLSLF